MKKRERQLKGALRIALALAVSPLILSLHPRGTVLEFRLETGSVLVKTLDVRSEVTQTEQTSEVAGQDASGGGQERLPGTAPRGTTAS